ncbi:MAG: glutamate racemase, partial [Oscillospiraceae bacterium]|nr:glutamate racemase [Oscillospiraceae bacterium]
LAEEGWWDGGIVRAIAERYLSELLGVGMDVLLLGCTHYPLLADAIRSVVGGGVELVSSGAPVAAALGEALGRIGRSDAPGRPDGGVEFYTSDSVERFQRLSSSFLGREVGSARWVDIEGY